MHTLHSSIHLSQFLRYSALVLSLFYTVPAALAQFVPSVGGADGTASDGSRMPFRIKFTGFLNTEPQEGSKVVKLGIRDFHETYQFEVVKIEAVDDKQLGEKAILQQVGKYAVDFELIGPRALLSKVGQADPGTPLTIVGFYTQRSRKLQLESVEIVGLKDSPQDVVE